MDEFQLAKAFHASISEEATVRNQAWEFLESIRGEPGLVPLLTKLAHVHESSEVRLLSTIFLKNTIRANYAQLPAQDLGFLRSCLLDCLNWSVPARVRAQFEEIALTLTAKDPEWALQRVDEVLAHDAADSLHAGLTLLLMLARSQESSVTAANAIVAKYFPRLFQVFSLQHAGCTLLVLQICWVCTRAVGRLASEPEKWLSFFKALIDCPSTPEVLECKRVAAQTVNVLLIRVPESPDYFLQHWAGPLLGSILPQLLNYSTLPEPLLTLYLQYAADARQRGVAPALFNPLAQTVVTQVVLPLLRLTPVDEALWCENPVEYVQQETTAGTGSVREAAVRLLQALCVSGCFAEFFVYATGQLGTTDLVAKEALLFALGSLSALVREHAEFTVAVSSMLATHVFAELSSGIGFLRARAAWTYAKFASFVVEEHQRDSLEKLCHLIGDPELPVKVHAAVALPKLLVWDVARTRLEPELKTLLSVYLELAQQLDCEELVDALTKVITVFPQNVLPYALDLAQHIASKFLHVHETAAASAVPLLNTLGTLVDTLADREDDLLGVSRLVQPVLERTLSGDAYFEEGISLLTCLLYYAPDNALPHLFPLLGVIRRGLCTEKYALAHASDAHSAIANYISKYSSLAVRHLDQFAEMLQELLGGNGESVVVGCKVLVSLLEYLNGHLDSLLCAVLPELAVAFQTHEALDVRLVLSSAVHVGLWYNPLLVLKELGRTRAALEALQFSLNNVDLMRDFLGRTYALVGIGSLLSVGPRLSAGIATQLPSLLTTFVTLSHQLHQPSDKEDSWAFEHDGLYDSVFEEFDALHYAHQVLQQLGETAPELLSQLVSQLNSENRTALQQLCNRHLTDLG